MEELTSLKEIADYMRNKAQEIGDAYLLESLKLLQAADILDPNESVES